MSYLATLSDEIIKSLVLNIMNLRSLLTTPVEILVGIWIYEYRDSWRYKLGLFKAMRLNEVNGEVSEKRE